MNPRRFRACAAEKYRWRALFCGGITAVLISFPSFGQAAVVTSSGSFSGGGIATSGSYSMTASLGCIGGSSTGGTVCNSGGETPALSLTGTTAGEADFLYYLTVNTEPATDRTPTARE